MCFFQPRRKESAQAPAGPPPVTPPPVEAAPTPVADRAAAVPPITGEDTASRARRRRGRGGTIVTGPLGLTVPSAGSRATLLGRSGTGVV